MNLDYHLAPDSPLLQEGVFLRITLEPSSYLLNKKAAELRGALMTREEYENALWDAITQDDLLQSLMKPAEADALLTFAGTVWFVAQHTGLTQERVAGLCMAGMPWPLRDSDDNEWATGILTPDQLDYLSQLFQPTDRLGQILVELAYDGWMAPGEQEDGPVQAARAYWEELAKLTGEAVNTVRQVALALTYYDQCISKFVNQRKVDEWRKNGGKQVRRPFG